MKTVLAQAMKAGIRFQIDGAELRVIAPSGAMTEELRTNLRAHREAILEFLRESAASPEQPLPELHAEPADRHLPFPLTEVQHAYWLGRDSAMEMGSVATHLYVELDCEDLDLPRLNAALCRMIERHDMLRAVVTGDGLQHILPTVPRYDIAIEDQSRSSPQDAERAVSISRDALSHQVLRADQWPLFEVRATCQPARRVRLHISLDLLILDAWSIFLFLREWRLLYDQPQTTLPDFAVSFRDYVLAERSLLDSPAYQRARAYWMERIDRLPPAPELPLRSDLTGRRSPRFSRREAGLDLARWDRLKALARSHGLTPSGVLLAAYSEVLARWSAQPHFTLNVTVSNRLQLHPDINYLLGDFTSLVMQEVDRRDHRLTFVEFARHLQQQFAQDLEQRIFSGVAVMREWAKRRGLPLQAIMPVVFSSGLIWSGEEEVGDLEVFGSKVYSVSQTSQVWLDHHVMELHGQLHFVWDAVDAVFEDGVLDAMFTAYCDLVGRLADEPATWHSHHSIALPAAMAERREQTNQTADALPQIRLHAGFVTQARQHPAAVAILATERTLSYGELLAESSAVAAWLRQRGLAPGQPVAILMHKGWEQIVAACGVLLAGGAYLPVDASLPVKRQANLLRIGEVTQVLTQPDSFREELAAAPYDILEIQAGTQGDYAALDLPTLDADLTQLAYVIFTSGTTGVPKGVMIDHRAAVNTIEHINRLYRVGAQDRVLAVSSLSFDLSVYDIFGLLAAGGGIVIPDHRKEHDPDHWRALMSEHRVTLWNSAPQLMHMLLDALYPEELATAPLRTVLLSGDFIPLTLPDRIREHYPDVAVISLGGATEAAIWSIYYPVLAVDPAWRSIPYGKPLPNQTIWVCDTALRVCPDHVKGRIYIGGIGLAQGYWRDAEKTAARFITHPETAARLYDTGDLGRYAADGNVVILGRDDNQIKIRGYRVELGEIETVLCQYPEIQQAVVRAVPGRRDSLQLAAYIEPVAGGDQPLNIPEVQDYLAERLPDYMVPQHLVTVDRMPVSANGKIDYSALPAITDAAADGHGERVLPRTPMEETIFAAWASVMTDCEMGVTDNFFELGGDSVLATQLVRALNTALPTFVLEMHELFENLTIEALADLYQRKSTTAVDPVTAAADAPTPAADAPATTADVPAPTADVPTSVAYSLRAAADSATFSAHRRLLTRLVRPAPSVDDVALHLDLQTALADLDTLDFKSGVQRSWSPPHAVLLTGATGWIGGHVLAELLSLTAATVYCLVRAPDTAAGHTRLLDTLRRYGCDIAPDWGHRIVPVCGDLTLPGWGVAPAQWQQLTETIDCIYHFAASVNVLANYVTHSRVNVDPLLTLVRLAVAHGPKPVFFSSPMTVCRRYQNGAIVVLYQEHAHPDPTGLLTGYAQSKWAGEQLLTAAAARGLPVKIYRSTHALPSACTGLMKSNDTYGTILQVAYEAGVVPVWPASALYGVPVDRLARLIVDNSLLADDYRGIVHLENRDPLSVPALLKVFLEDRSGGEAPPSVMLDEWKQRCREAALHLPDDTAGLARLLFTDRPTGAAVENMLAAHPIDTGYFDHAGRIVELSHLTPSSYWLLVCQQFTHSQTSEVTTMHKAEQFRSLVAQGWTMMCIVFVSNLLVDLIKNSVAGPALQVPWAEHLSMGGIQFILVIISIYAIMPVLIRTLSATWFRWTVVGLTVAMGLFVAAHEISHLTALTKPWGLFHALDITHHILVVWVTIGATLWARQPIVRLPQP